MHSGSFRMSGTSAEAEIECVGGVVLGAILTHV